jgi:outer membrane protein assembly factor BamB
MFAADWPQFRCDAAHTARSPDDLPASLHLTWVREEPPLASAWPDQPMMQFDAAYDPVVAGDSVFVSSSLTDSISAWNLNTGAGRWRFITNGPVRFPPAVSQGRVYAVSDDGWLYCLCADDGKLLWKFRGGLDDRRVLGNERMVSMWPARGAPVVVEDTVYFAASIWPFMGIFIHALDAETGEVRWTNDGDGSIYIKQPHMTDSFAGVAPQGVLGAVGDRLLIPGGRSVPASYDRKTGKLQHFLLGENSKKGGGTTVGAGTHFFVNGGGLFSLETGKHLGSLAAPAKASKSGASALTGSASVLPPPPLEHFVIDGKTIYGLHGGKLLAWKAISEADAKQGAKTKPFASVSLPGATTMIQAGSRLIIGLPDKVCAVMPPQTGDENVETAWQVALQGTPARLVAANDRLLVSTLEGRVYCFSAQKQEPVKLPSGFGVATNRKSEDAWSQRVKDLLDQSHARAGYCLVYGWGNGRLVRELVRQSQLRIVVVESDPAIAQTAREELITAGLYGKRASVLHSSLEDAGLPPYFANLIVAEDLESLFGELPRAEFFQQAYTSLRPYGGAFWFPASEEDKPAFEKLLMTASLAKAAIRAVPSGMLVAREGALPGAADWTHEHADAANTRVSRDSLVKAPLGLLWFGGTSNEGILPRHGHGPQPQVFEGRVFIEGMDKLRAVDIYSGRQLWEAKLPGVGMVYDNTAHQAGANATGTNFISSPEGLYVALGNKCLLLSLDTGKTLREFTLPAKSGEKPPRWGYLNVAGDYLIAGSDPIFDADLDKHARGLSKGWKLGENDNLSSSRALVVLDRHTGKTLWQHEARCGFRHNGICVGGGRIYAIDRYSGAQLLRLSLASKALAAQPRLVAFDLKTGKEVWSSSKEIFGTWLSYSELHDVLVESGRMARDTLLDEPKGMRAWQAKTGKPLWHNERYVGPAMIHGNLILKEQNACDLLTGKPRMRLDPLTGQQIEWGWTRTYGCNTPMASEHLLTFRSGAAGYCDLTGDGGTSNLGGFRSSCTNNLVVAGGVLCAPDYTRTCTCSYQNQTSLGLVHMPGVETWTSFGKLDIKPPIRKLGVNLGAPGDRKAEDGTLWLEAPSVGGGSPALEMKITGKETHWFRRHEGQFAGTLPWVAASGVIGAETIELKFSTPPKPIDSKDKEKKQKKESETKEAGKTKVPPEAAKTPPISPRRYTVKLFFSEPDVIEPGQRVFDVRLQGKLALKSVDIVQAAGGPRRTWVKEIPGVQIGETLTIALSPNKDSLPPVLSGWQLQAEGW